MQHAVRRRLALQLRRQADDTNGDDPVRTALASLLAAASPTTGSGVMATIGAPDGTLVDRVRSEWPPELLGDPLTPGWCYQYLRNPERAARRDAYVRTQGKATAADLSLVTQLYTPAFMVEHLLRAALAAGDVAHRRVLDPACGTGHFLVPAVRLLASRRRLELGESAPEAAARVLQDQLGGCDVDPLAVSLTRLALQRVALDAGLPLADVPAPRVDTAGGDGSVGTPAADDGARPFGHQRVVAFREADALAWARAHPQQVGAAVPRAWHDRLPVPGVLCERWSVVATNPPFLDRRELNRGLMQWLKTVAPLAGGRNLFAAFVELAHEWLDEEPAPDGVPPTLALVLPQPFAFLPAFEKLRRRWLETFAPRELVHFGLRAWPDATVDTLLLRSDRRTDGSVDDGDTCTCRRITDVRSVEDAEQALATDSTATKYVVPAGLFARHPRAALVYQLVPGMWRVLTDGPRLAEVAKSRQGMSTNDNARFLRYWWEVQSHDVGYGRRWVPYVKGGEFARWLGNRLHVVLWADDGAAVRAAARERYRTETRTVKNQSFFFRRGLTYTLVSSKGFSARLLPPGCIFDVGGACTFPADDPPDLWLAVLAWLNSIAVRYLLEALNPTVNHQVGDLDRLPWPDFDDATRAVLAGLAGRCIELRQDLLRDVPTEPQFGEGPDGRVCEPRFSAPTVCPDGTRTAGELADALRARAVQRHHAWVELRTAEAEIDGLVLEVLGITGREREILFRQIGRPHGWLPGRVADEPPPPHEFPADRLAWEQNVHPRDLSPDDDDTLVTLRESWAIARMAALPFAPPQGLTGGEVETALAPLPDEWVRSQLPKLMERRFRKRPPFRCDGSHWYRVFRDTD